MAWHIPDPSTDDLLGSVAVVDTNVMHEILSLSDVHDAYEQTGNLDSEEVSRRRNRVKGSLILFFHLHERRVKTLSMQRELLNLLERTSPPESRTVKSAFVSFTLHHLLDEILTGWQSVSVNEEFVDEPDGNRADDALIEIAQRYRLPLISNEGVRNDGIIDHKNRMRKRAARVGVAVVSPGDYWASRGIDSAGAADRFLAAFDAWLGPYVERHRMDTMAARAAAHVRRYYAWILSD